MNARMIGSGLGVVVLASIDAMAQELPPVPVPPENPMTEEKRVLGKILFWEEQLSSDNSIACGTCHLPASGGSDPRLGAHPGADGILGNADDVVGSPGVIRADHDDRYKPDLLFGLGLQVTRRSANTTMMAAYAPDLFWDGRAGSRFVDPQTGVVRIPKGGGLESQAVIPIVSDVEMAHETRDWDQVVAKLAVAKPLQLASNIPADLDQIIQTRTSYPELFDAAFGDPAITATRIALAIATYERTLIPNQTRWDAYIAGDPDAMTEDQVNGWIAFSASNCATCHEPPQFTDHSFRNIGLRPPAEDLGRQLVTGDPSDRGKFKVPTLRNVLFKPTMMHNGRINGIGDMMDFYLEQNGHQHFEDNLDPEIKTLVIPPHEVPFIIDFVRNALSDTRVVNEQFPFDRPSLHGENPALPVLLGDGTPGTGGVVPAIIAVSPSNVGNTDFKLGVQDALGGAAAIVAISTSPPIEGNVVADVASDPIAIDADGYATFRWPIAFAPPLDGRTIYAQWTVADPGAAGGEARSRVVQLDVFCGGYCACGSDVNGDGAVGFADLLVVLGEWGPCVFCASDLDGNDTTDFADVLAVLSAWGVCPSK